MTGPTTDHTNAIVADLAALLHQARWAHGYAYAPAGRGIAPTPGTALNQRSTTTTTDPDHTTAPLYDLGIGNHRARSAWAQAVTATNTVNTALAAILHTTRTPQPPVHHLPTHTHLTHLETAINHATWRAHHLTPTHQHTHRATLAKLRHHLDGAIRNFSAALDHGPTNGITHPHQPTNPTPADQRCNICGWRKRRPKDGQRCPTCAKYHQRNGVERPTHLDGINPYDAQSKRHQRGEGWGHA